MKNLCPGTDFERLGVYFNCRFVLNFLLVAFDVPSNAFLRKLCRDLVNSFGPDYIAELKSELEMFLRSGGPFPLVSFNRLLEKLINDSRYRVLTSELLRNGRLINFGGQARVNFRLHDL